jgi:hypothetical protein
MSTSQNFPAFPTTVPAARQFPLVLNKSDVTSSGGVLTLDVSQGSVFTVSLHENIANWTIINPTDGQPLTIIWRQDATGGWTVGTAPNVSGFSTPSGVALTTTAMDFVYDASGVLLSSPPIDGVWYEVAGGSGGGGGGVTSLNGLTGVVDVTAGSGISVAVVGSNVQVSATGGGGGVSSLNTLTGAVVVTSPNGTISVGTSGSDVTLDVTAPLPVAYGGTGTTSPALVAGSGISITGSWPDQTITASGSAPSFSNITSGTNNSATMIVGGGATLTFNDSGSPPSVGVVNANELYGVVISSTPPSAGQVLTATGSAAANWQTPSSGGASQTFWNWPKQLGAPTNMNPVNGQNMNFTANQVKFMYIHIDVELSVGNFTFLPTTNDNTHFYDWGLYNLSGTLIWNIGPTQVTASSGQWTSPFLQGTVTIPEGNYWLAFTGNGTGLTFFAASPSGLVDDYMFFANTPTGSGPLWWTSSTTSSGGSLTGLGPVLPATPTTASNLTSNQVSTVGTASFPMICLST